jgi:hypothetical protein
MQKATTVPLEKFEAADSRPVLSPLSFFEALLSLGIFSRGKPNTDYPEPA